MESNSSWNNFHTITLGNGNVWDDHLDWKNQTDWQEKIQALGLIIEK